MDWVWAPYNYYVVQWNVDAFPFSQLWNPFLKVIGNILIDCRSQLLFFCCKIVRYEKRNYLNILHFLKIYVVFCVLVLG